jgi:hypothetical protein
MDVFDMEMGGFHRKKCVFDMEKGVFDMEMVDMI